LLQLCSSELQQIEGLSCFRKILTLQGFDVWAGGRVDLFLHFLILSSIICHFISTIKMGTTSHPTLSKDPNLKIKNID
jgi:hypothetical protein